jgi:hypothetical protein
LLIDKYYPFFWHFNKRCNQSGCDDAPMIAWDRAPMTLHRKQPTTRDLVICCPRRRDLHGHSDNRERSKDSALARPHEHQR